MTLLSTLLTAFMVGLLGSVHCFGMCGGIAAAMGTSKIGLGTATRWGAAKKAFLFNGGRILSYSILGLIVGGITGSIGQILELKQWGFSLRMLTALLIFLMGLQYLTKRSFLGWLERGGGTLWQWISGKILSRNRAPTADAGVHESWVIFRTGILWGWLPCGLVYSILLTAAASGEAIPAALIMLAFGLGTLPALASLTVAGPLISQLRSSTQARRIIGIAMMIFALWIAIWALLHSGILDTTIADSGGHHQH